MKRLLFCILCSWSLNTFALTPAEVQTLVQNARQSVERLPQVQEEDLAIVEAMEQKNPDAFAQYKKPELGDFLL